MIEFNLNKDFIDHHSDYNLTKLDSSDEFIFKIHGSYQNIEKCIIFSSDYEELYNKENLANLQLKKIISSNTCLFIGFSFTDEYVENLFTYIDEIYKNLGKKHFIISKENISKDYLETIKIENHNDLEYLLDLIISKKFTPKEKPNNTLSINETQGTRTTKNYSPNDTAPITEYWTGRDEELRTLSLEQKAYFITGIGGQGKSALASKFLDISKSQSYRYLDWRDFKEEDLNLQTKLFSLIEIVSDNKINKEEIIGLETRDLIDLFFKELDDKKGIFVFDNIDKYIDLEKFIPTGEMYDFFKKSISIRHRSKFIFTCRPFIKYAIVGSQQINLQGLETTEIKNLIRFYYQKIDEQQISKTADTLHQSTQGHPLWINLILAQSRSDFNNIKTLVDDINLNRIKNSESNYSSIISKTILENLWNGLKEYEKIILRALSVSAISESEEELAKIIEKKVRYNKFTKSLKSLKLLNLVIEKQERGYIELHPLVREFIITNYGRDEQESFISLYISYLDGFLIKIQEKFGGKINTEEAEKIIKKIEISIDASNFQEASNDLRKSWHSFILSGYSEEQIRLSSKLLDKIHWSISSLGKINGFMSFLELFFTRCSEFGCYEIFEKYISKYNATYKNIDKTTILARSLICQNFWHQNDFINAINAGKSAIDLMDHLGTEDIYSGRHNYYLALRDSKIEENIIIAARYFSQELETNEIINLPEEKVDPIMIGNLARCFEYQAKYDIALQLLFKCFKKLFSEDLTHNNEHNLGYASKWLSEILINIENTSAYIYFMVFSRNLWEKDMPEKANIVNYELRRISETQEKKSILSLESWQIEKFCKDYVSKKNNQINDEKNLSKIHLKASPITKII